MSRQELLNRIVDRKLQTAGNKNLCLAQRVFCVCNADKNKQVVAKN